MPLGYEILGSCNKMSIAKKKRVYKKSGSTSWKGKTGWKKAEVVREARIERDWSIYQKDIFNDVLNGVGNTQVDALAGTGKTSTIVESCYYVPQTESSLLCAFNKRIQEELERRSPEWVDVKTLHSLGYGACRRAFPKIGSPNKDKLSDYVRADRGDKAETYDLREGLGRAVSLCKGYLVDDEEGIDEILDKHDIDICGDKRGEFIGSVIKIMNACKKDTKQVDFDDMIWLPNVHGLSLTKYDRVFIDEAQDLNLAQINLALNSCKEEGRILSVGDEHQAIYGFRGADSNAIQSIVNRMGSKRMPLSVTYRCALSIVRLAQTLVPALEAAPGAIEGKVERIKDVELIKRVRPGDFILSRTNAPLIKWCLALLRERIPANIQGRDIGQNLTGMIRKSKQKSVNSFLDWLKDYSRMEIGRMLKLKRDPTTIEDKAACLEALCDGATSLNEVKDNIDRLFKDGDDKNRVILSTTHKAKGLERDRVFMLEGTYRRGKDTREENNLVYVAWTRAKNELYLVTKSIT
jgi:superfamily I DNA/RNA helicase